MPLLTIVRSPDIVGAMHITLAEKLEQVISDMVVVTVRVASYTIGRMLGQVGNRVVIGYRITIDMLSVRTDSTSPRFARPIHCNYYKSNADDDDGDVHHHWGSDQCTQ